MFENIFKFLAIMDDETTPDPQTARTVREVLDGIVFLYIVFLIAHKDFQNV
jgi:hypothetical protein